MGKCPVKLLNVGENQPKSLALVERRTFWDDWYMEIMRHGKKMKRVNRCWIQFAPKA